MNLPYDIKNTAMDNTIKTIKIEPNWNSVALKMRETDVAFLIYNNAETKYFTVPAGQTINLSSYNFSSGNSTDNVKVKAASGTLEMLGFLRDG